MHRKVIEIPRREGDEIGPREYELGPVEFTERDLREIPETDAVLWQDDDGPTSIIDSQGIVWMIGKYNGWLCKRRVR